MNLYTGLLFRRAGLAGLFTVVFLFGCHHRQQSFSWNRPDVPIVAQAEILSLQRSPIAPARFFGKARLRQPTRYRGLEVECIFLSPESDLSKFAGQTVEVATHLQALEMQLKPELDLFGGDNTPMLKAEFRDGHFAEIDSTHYESPIRVRGRIEAYSPDPEHKSLYMIFDMGSSGDLATLVVETPARYRGTKLSFLNEDNSSNVSSLWSLVGNEVEFSTSEWTLAWEPWGFTRIAELKDVVFLSPQAK